MNLQECVWENLHQIMIKTILQEKETIHYSTIPMLQAMKIPAAKAAVDKEWEKLENFFVEPDESQK